MAEPGRLISSDEVWAPLPPAGDPDLIPTGHPRGHLFMWNNETTVFCYYCFGEWLELNGHRWSLGRWRTHYASQDGAPPSQCIRMEHYRNPECNCLKCSENGESK